MSVSFHPQLHFLPWDRPLPAQAAAWLADKWGGEGPLDLSSRLAVVPTKQSGFRLREAFAVHAAIYRQAVFPPQVLTPEALLDLNLDGRAASRLDSHLAWVDVFLRLDLKNFRVVFPLDPPEQNFLWAHRLARDFYRLQVALMEVGLRFDEVALRAGDRFSEAERWRQIGQLERLHSERLAACGLVDPQARKIAAASGAPPAGVEHLVLLGLPDPLPVVLAMFQRWAERLPVDVVVFGDPMRPEAFDAWGGPDVEGWLNKKIVLPDFESHVHLAADPTAQAQYLAELAKSCEQPDRVLALGLADTELVAPVAGALAQVSIASFDPEGEAQCETSLYQLVRALSELAANGDFSAVAVLARCPEFLKFLDAQVPEFSAARWLEGLDALWAESLPANLEAARRQAVGLQKRFSNLSPGLDAMDVVRRKLCDDDFAVGFSKALSLLFSARQLDLQRTDDAEFEAAAEAWTQTLRDCAAAALCFPGIDAANWRELALQSFGEAKLRAEKPGGAIALQSWLELLWEDAPRLVVAGFNNGCVPETVVGDAFLPEALRAKLGFKTNETRLARDTYLLQALVECRRGAGRLDLVYGKNSAVGDPLRPSRLLLRCADEELPRRVEFLFRASSAVETNFPWTCAWQLEPRLEPAPVRVGVTALRGYLECPFRFYLKQVLKMEAVNTEKAEMDARDFGNLCHEALETFGCDEVARASADAEFLCDFLLGKFDTIVRRRYGPDLTLPLAVQMASARQRLGKLAEVQAATRAEGWLIEEVERPFELEIRGLVVCGKIDRIERNEATGARRVLDYKTQDTSIGPEKVHLRNVRAGEMPPEWAYLNSDGKHKVWMDLQLPLYCEALRAEFGAELMCSYFNLPKAVGETGIETWESYSTYMQSSAWRCAEAVCAAICAGHFWPPNETLRPELDDFASLFHRGVAASVRWRGNV